MSLIYSSVQTLQDKTVDELVKSAFELYQQKRFDEALAIAQKLSRKARKIFDRALLRVLFTWRNGR
jgi:hypothetical protein